MHDEQDDKELEIKGTIPIGSEGNLTVSVSSSLAYQSEQEVNGFDYVSVLLTHGLCCFGRFISRKISNLSVALFCKDCGLRLIIPAKLRTIKNLRDFFTNHPYSSPE